MEITPTAVAKLLQGHRFLFDNEEELQGGIDAVLSDAGIPFKREARLAAADIVDFLLPGGLAVEVKIKGSPTAVASQLLRYAESNEVHGLILVTARLQIAQDLPRTLNGKPLLVVGLWKGML